MGWRAQELDRAEKVRNQSFVFSMFTQERARFSVWQYAGLSILISAIALFVLLMVSAHSEPIEPQQIQVLDGDTIRVGKNVFRLVGFDTPETGSKAKCFKEQKLGGEATRRLRHVVAQGALQFEQIPCSCPSGTEGSRRCNHGRLCGRLTSKGRDVGDILISENLARSFVCGVSKCPRRKTWC